MLHNIFPNIKNFCTKIVPFVDFYKKQIDYYNKTSYDILPKEMPLILPIFPNKQKRKERYSNLTRNRFNQIGV